MRILIVKSSALGDIIHTYPVIAYLHDRFPDCEIDWVVEEPFKQLVEAHPLVHRAIPISTKKWRKSPFSRETWREWRATRRQLRATTYDVLFDLQGNIKSALFTKQARARHKVGFAKPSEWLNKLVTSKRFTPPPGRNIRDDYLSIVQQFFRDNRPYKAPGVTLENRAPLPLLPPSPVMLVCPGSAWRNKQVTPEALLEFCRLVRAEHANTFAFVWGNEEEQLFAERLHRALPDCSTVIPKLPLPALQNLMARADLVFAVDSLALHLCGTTETPSFSVFGPSSAQKYCPTGGQHIQGVCPYGRTFEKRCPILRKCSTGLCTRGLTGDYLFEVFQKLS
jgi:lipopolysaccharide heptosyltransferase I